MAFFNQFLGALQFGLLNMAWTFIALWGVERLFPKGRQATIREQLLSLRFWLFYALAGAFIGTAFAGFKTALSLKPLYSIPFAETVFASPWPWTIYVLGPLGSMVAYDFFNYWMHRAQHRWFWRQHSIHHSIDNLSAVNSYMHWTEDFFRIAFVSLPTVLLFNVHVGGITLISAMLVAAQGNFIHSACALNFGRYGRWFVADNRYHRIHHSKDPTHFDRNFATSTPIWDILFGTAYFPRTDEWPDTGLPDQSAPTTIGDYLFRPFLPHDRGNAAVGTLKPEL